MQVPPGQFPADLVGKARRIVAGGEVVVGKTLFKGQLQMLQALVPHGIQGFGHGGGAVSIVGTHTKLNHCNPS